jgi:hypothetical protein
LDPDKQWKRLSIPFDRGTFEGPQFLLVGTEVLQRPMAKIPKEW